MKELKYILGILLIVVSTSLFGETHYMPASELLRQCEGVKAKSADTDELLASMAHTATCVSYTEGFVDSLNLTDKENI